MFVWAHMSDCFKIVKVLEQSLSDKEAERKIKKIDAHRSDYYRYYTCREWDSFKNYDLCINSSSAGFDKTAKYIEEFVKIKLGK